MPEEPIITKPSNLKNWYILLAGIIGGYLLLVLLNYIILSNVCKKGGKDWGNDDAVADMRKKIFIPFYFIVVLTNKKNCPPTITWGY